MLYIHIVHRLLHIWGPVDDFFAVDEVHRADDLLEEVPALLAGELDG